MISIRTVFVAAAALFTLAFSNVVLASEVSTAYQAKSAPKYHITESGVAEGIVIDVMRAVEERLGDVNFYSGSTIPLKRIEALLEAGKIDVFFGLARNAKREKKYTYVEIPLYDVQHVVAVRKGEHIDIQSFDDIRALGENGTILTNSGSATERYLKKQSGLKVDASGKNLSQNLKKLLAGRGEFVYFHDLGLYHALNNEFKGQPLDILNQSFRTYGHYIAFSKSVDEELINRVAEAMKELKADGTLDTIAQKYKTV